VHKLRIPTFSGPGLSKIQILQCRSALDFRERIFLIEVRIGHQSRTSITLHGPAPATMVINRPKYTDSTEGLNGVQCHR